MISDGRVNRKNPEKRGGERQGDLWGGWGDKGDPIKYLAVWRSGGQKVETKYGGEGKGKEAREEEVR